MNIRKLTSTLAKLEKTKSQAKIQAIRSIVGHLSDIFYSEHIVSQDYDTVDWLIINGQRRFKKGKGRARRGAARQ